MKDKISAFGFVVLSLVFALFLANAVYTGTVAFSSATMPPGISKTFATIMFAINLILAILVLVYMIMASRKQFKNKEDVVKEFKLTA